MTAWIRRASTRTLVGIGIAALAVFVAANVVVSRSGASAAAPPPPATLSELVLREAGAAGPVGMSADFRYVNGMVPDTSSLPAITGGGPTPLLEGANGRLWWGGGVLRIEFQTDAGDTQLLVHGDRALMYDASAGNAFSVQLPSLGSSASARTGIAGAVQLLAGLRGQVRFSRPQPNVTAGRPSYSVVMRPAGRADSLIGAVRLVVDADTAVPLGVDVYGRGQTQPVVEIALSNVHFGPIDPSVFDLHLPYGMRPAPIRFSSPPSLGGASGCAGPARLAGLPLTGCRLTTGSKTAGRVLVYGRSLGSVVVLEEPGGGDPEGGLWQLLPGISVGDVSGRELTTVLGTLIRFGRGGVTYTVVGSRPRAVVEAAARGL